MLSKLGGEDVNILLNGENWSIASKIMHQISINDA